MGRRRLKRHGALVDTLQEGIVVQVFQHGQRSNSIARTVAPYWSSAPTISVWPTTAKRRVLNQVRAIGLTGLAHYGKARKSRPGNKIYPVLCRTNSAST
jgi:hypothetical protein